MTIAEPDARARIDDEADGFRALNITVGAALVARWREWFAPARRPSGTVLVWRSADGLAQHGAVTIGGRWALHKPSQCWDSPTKVLTVAGVKASARTPGWRLSRHALVG
ncbi:hypothetical protein [Xylanimonas ulmi]|uniref:hypothetical protein n=1 Tax=Xylanimonas ulmi TaxID=228973 RepID=UPI00102C2413|nr:hypothetical protein [Xylanibacterium ulmi]